VSYLASFIHSVSTYRYVFSSTYNLSWDLNFLWVIRYKTTRPKLKTSDLKALFPTIFEPLILISYGAKNGTVPKIVASSKLSLDSTLLLPTSHSLIVNFLLFMIRMFSGLMSQCALLMSYREAREARICSAMMMI